MAGLPDVGHLGLLVQLAADAVEALVRAAATVSPRGKQASFASRARATYILAECGTQQPRSLAAAFLRPVSFKAGQGVDEASIAELTGFREALDAAYGPCTDGSAQMVVRRGDDGRPMAEGTLDEVVKFAWGCCG